jgi:serine/threonine protein kinase
LLNNEFYALKEIPKFKLYTYSKIYSHLTEPNILKKLIQYDFLPKIISSFQDYDNIYLITTFYDGKTLDFFKNGKITEEQIKFVSACVIQSLIYLREKKIIHRDIMMKNIIMDKSKYFNIIDFSFSIEYSEKNNRAKYLYTYNEVTPPEMMRLEEFYYNSDYYRLGSIIYYLIFKTYPYFVKLQNNIDKK